MGFLDNAARQGRGGDTLLGHLTPGDVVIPAEQVTPQIQGLLGQILGNQLGRFTAGAPGNSLNPKTGLPEFEGTGADGSGEGPGAEGGVGGTGPGGGGTGGPGHGASGDNPGADTGLGDNGFSGSKMTRDQTTPGFGARLGKTVVDMAVPSTVNAVVSAITGKTIGEHAFGSSGSGLAGLMGHDSNDQADAPATGPAESSGGGTGGTGGANTGGSQANGGSNGGGFFNAISPLLAPSAPPPAPGAGLLGVAPQPQVPRFVWPSFLGAPPPGFLR